MFFIKLVEFCAIFQIRVSLKRHASLVRAPISRSIPVAPPNSGLEHPRTTLGHPREDAGQHHSEEREREVPSTDR